MICSTPHPTEVWPVTVTLLDGTQTESASWAVRGFDRVSFLVSAVPAAANIIAILEARPLDIPAAVWIVVWPLNPGLDSEDVTGDYAWRVTARAAGPVVRMTGERSDFYREISPAPPRPIN